MMATALNPALNPDVFGMQPRLPTAKPKVSTPMGAAEERLAGTEEKLGGALKEQAEFTGQQALQKQKQEAAKAKGEAEILGKQAEELRAAEEPIRLAEDEKMKARFAPTRETAMEMAGLYSLINVIGFAIGRGGKQSSMQALSAMNGMLEGYRQGSTDRFNQEKKLFDANLKQLTDNVNTLTNRLQRVVQLSTVDKLKAQQELTVALAESGADFVKENINKFGLPATIQYLKQVQTAAQRAVDKERDFERRAEAKARETADRQAFQKELQQQRLDAQRQLQADRLANQASRRGGALNDRYAFNINEAFSQAAIDLLNVSQMPEKTTLGAFAGMTGQGGDTIIKSLANNFARAVTKEDSRLMQQIVSGLDQNMARALGGGYANSSAKAIVNAYKEQVAQFGDSAAAQAMFLARMKQELEVLSKAFKNHPGANEGYVNDMKEYVDSLNQAIPFNVQQVIAANRGNQRTITQKFQSLSQQPSSIRLPQTGVPSAPAATRPPAAQETGWSNADEERLRELEEKARGTKSE